MKRMEWVQAENQAIREEMARDNRVFVIGEDVGLNGGAYSTIKNLFHEFPGRVIDSPISENGLIGIGIGAAITGLRPIVDIMFGDFFGVCADQISNQLAKNKYMFGGKAVLPVVVKTQQGGYVQNAAQHSSCNEAWFCHVPGLKIVMPSCAADAYGLMKSAIRDDNPVLFIDQKAGYDDKGSMPDGEYLIPLGVADIKRLGKDVTIIATSLMVSKALRASQELSATGIDAEVVDPRTLVPLDKKTIINSVKKTGRAVIVHEAVEYCGWGAEMAAEIANEAFEYLDAPVERVAAPFCPVPYSRSLELAMLPSEERITAAVRKVCAY